jgi:hypothetical protein
MDDKEVKDQLTPEEMAKAWENYVRNEVNTLLDIFLPEAVSGNVGVIYSHPVKEVSAKTGESIVDKDKATAVDIHIVLDFPEAIQFFDEKPTE